MNGELIYWNKMKDMHNARWPWTNSMKIAFRNFDNFSKILEIAENGSRGEKH